MGPSNTSLFPMPTTRQDEVLTVKLESGEVVTRSPRNLVVLPPGLVVSLEDLAEPDRS